jgi:hypothetical protein
VKTMRRHKLAAVLALSVAGAIAMLAIPGSGPAARALVPEPPKIPDVQDLAEVGEALVAGSTVTVQTITKPDGTSWVVTQFTVVPSGICLEVDGSDPVSGPLGGLQGCGHDLAAAGGVFDYSVGGLTVGPVAYTVVNGLAAPSVASVRAHLSDSTTVSASTVLGTWAIVVAKDVNVTSLDALDASGVLLATVTTVYQ